VKVVKTCIGKFSVTRTKVKLGKPSILFVLTAIVASTISAPIGYGIETAPYAKPSSKNDLQKLIGTFPKTLETQRERADASDLYRAPGEPIINEWFKVDGVNRGFLSISSFSRFTLMPSYLGTKTKSKPIDLSDVFSYAANLPPCFESTHTDCIYDFSLINEDNSILKAEPYAALPQVAVYPNVLWTGNNYGAGDWPFETFTGNKELNLPSGGDLWIWDVPNLNPGKPSLYSASVLLSSARNELLNAKFPNPDTRLQISPVEVDLPVCRLPHDGNGCTWRDFQTGLDGAIFDSEKISLKRSANNFTGKYRLGFKLSVPWTSWLISTVSGVDIQASRQGGSYVYEVSGNPSTIPTIRRFFPVDESYWATFGDVLNDKNNNLLYSNLCPTRAADCYPIISLGKYNINDVSFQMLESAERLIGAKASYLTKTWAIMSSSLASYNNPKDAKTELQICSERNATDRPAGITGSNATIFEHSPPTWDKNSRTFTYQVGSFKETPDGSKFLGDYSLLVSTDVARCLWGVDVGSAKAALQVVSSAGDKQVATTIVNSNSKWFRFRASGFHFSSPRIVASISKVSPAKTLTITCVKGKVTKKVTAVKPKCPSGYKKK
jgi:hypothetical protein